jgi:predicted aconitase
VTTIHLTKEEEHIYDGERGWANQTAMRILAKLGDLYDASRLIPIESAHVSGVSYKNIGDAPIEFLAALAKAGAKAKVPSTINPSGLDYDGVIKSAVSSDTMKKQARIIDLYREMGVDPVLTCTPYYLQKPSRGAHLAWAESSTVIYANSVLGSWMNREGGPSALAAALIGKTPDYGMHRPESREANILVKVEAELTDEAQYGALGIHLGKVLKDKVPALEGLSMPQEGDLKQLGAALASTGMTSIFHPCNSCPKSARKIETLKVDKADLKRSFETLSTTDDKPDMVFVGCPHCSLNEVKSVAELLDGKKVKKDVRFWVYTSRHVRERTKDNIRTIEAAGAKVVSDTCAVVTWLQELGVDTLMTNSAKTAYYAPTMNKVNVRFAALSQCVKAACQK